MAGVVAHIPTEEPGVGRHRAGAANEGALLVDGLVAPRAWDLNARRGGGGDVHGRVVGVLALGLGSEVERLAGRRVERHGRGEGKLEVVRLGGEKLLHLRVCSGLHQPLADLAGGRGGYIEELFVGRGGSGEAEE